jgi:hypothetical protein
MSDLLDPALLELHEGGCIANEFLARAPEDAYDQILVVGVTRRRRRRCGVAHRSDWYQLRS